MSDTKQQILDMLDGLPEEQQRRVLDFARRLQSQVESNDVDAREKGSPNEDPLLDAIGIFDSGNLATDIDEELYGE